MDGKWFIENGDGRSVAAQGVGGGVTKLPPRNPAFPLQDFAAVRFAVAVEAPGTSPWGQLRHRMRRPSHAGIRPDSPARFVRHPAQQTIDPGRYAHSQARPRTDSIESVSAYFSDCGDWSDNALRDGYSHLRKTGLFRPGYFRKGEWVRAKASEASRKVDLGDPIGLRRFSLLSMPELDEVGRALTDCEFRSYAYLSGLRNALAAITIALLPLPEEQGVRLLRGMFRRNRLPVAGFVEAHVAGRTERRRAALKARVEFDAGQEYWMNGVALATAARMVSAGNRLRTGVHYLFEAVEPTPFMAELRKAGVRQSETFEFCD